MRRKTIIKTIRETLNPWLDTLPLRLRASVMNNLVVTGGCIPSMFLGETVNDYDVYFKDKQVAYDLAQFYQQEFKLPITVLSTEQKREGFEASIEDEDIRNGFIVYNKSLKVEQVGLWIESGEGLYITDLEGDYVPRAISSNAISLSNQIQLIFRFTGSIKTIHSNFDFIHATNYFTFEEGLVTNVPALESILSKTLYYSGSKYPITSILRAKKFILRGWKISAGEFLKMAFQISLLDLTNPVVLAEQLAGVDMAYFSIIVDAVRAFKAANPDKPLTFEYLVTLIDKIFNENEL